MENCLSAAVANVVYYTKKVTEDSFQDDKLVKIKSQMNLCRAIMNLALIIPDYIKHTNYESLCEVEKHYQQLNSEFWSEPQSDKKETTRNQTL